MTDHILQWYPISGREVSMASIRETPRAMTYSSISPPSISWYFPSPVPNKETDLDVHNIQVLFQLLVGTDLLHHLSLQSLALWKKRTRSRLITAIWEYWRHYIPVPACDIKRALTQLLWEVNVTLFQECQELPHCWGGRLCPCFYLNYWER